MKTTWIVSLLLVLAPLAIAPSASADDCDPLPDRHMCHITEYPDCLLGTEPYNWTERCRVTGYFNEVIPVIILPQPVREAIAFVMGKAAPFQAYALCVGGYILFHPPEEYTGLPYACTIPSAP